MKVSAINHSMNRNYNNRKATGNNLEITNKTNNSVRFEGKGGKFLGGLLGGAAGGAAGGAIIGGGSLVGATLLAASGPVGWGLAALYTVGGAVVGGYVGSGIGDKLEDKPDKKSGDKN